MKSTNDMSRSEAAEITKQIEAAAKSIGFVTTNASYDIFRAFWNADVLYQKGVYVCGKPGIGKTFTFEAIHRWEVMIKRPAPLMNINIRTIEDRYRADKEIFLDEISNYPRVAFHNFGFENEAIPDFGSKRNVFLDILDRRYDKYQQGKQNRTYITSNYNGKKVASYGPIVLRRVAEMMKYYEIK